jgi:hypothetical protein
VGSPGYTAILRGSGQVQGSLGRYSWASVYLDPHNLLGYYEGEPYWEVYPYLDDVGRCDMDDIETLLEMIRTSLE